LEKKRLTKVFSILLEGSFSQEGWERGFILRFRRDVPPRLLTLTYLCQKIGSSSNLLMHRLPKFTTWPLPKFCEEFAWELQYVKKIHRIDYQSGDFGVVHMKERTGSRKSAKTPL